jgi:hypothetical protein
MPAKTVVIQVKNDAKKRNNKKKSSNNKTKASRGTKSFRKAIAGTVPQSFKSRNQGYTKVLNSVAKGTNNLKMDSMLRSFVLPFDTLAQRLPANQIVPTVACKIFSLRDLNFTTNALVTDQSTGAGATDSFFGAVGNFMAFCFRDVFRSMVVYEPNVQKNTNLYTLQFAAETSDDNGIDDLYVCPANESADLAVAYLTLTQINGSTPNSSGMHSDYFFAGASPTSSERYFWIDATTAHPAILDFIPYLGTTTSVVYAQNASQYPTNDYPIDVIKLKTISEPRHGAERVTSFANEDGVSTRAWVNAGATVAPFHAIEITITQRGYYSFRYNGLAPTASTDKFVGFKATYLIPPIDVFSHLCLPGILTELPKMNSVRVNGAALMLTCKAPEIQKAGQISMLERVPTVPWFEVATGFKDFTTVTSELGQSAETFEWANGGYAFVKPARAEDLDFNRSVQPDRTGSFINDVAFDLVGMSYVAYYISTGISQAGLGYLTSGHQVEYTSTSQWASRSPSPGGHNRLALLVEKLRSIPQCHENPFHMSDLLSYLKSGAQWTYKNKDKIAKILATIAPLAM